MFNEIVWKEVFPAVVNDISELKVIVPYAAMLGIFAAAIGFVFFGKLSDALLSLISVSYISLLAYRCFLNRLPSENVVFDVRMGQTLLNYSNYHFYIDNILLFIPAGILGTIISKKSWRGIVASVLLSLCVETVQIMTQLGSFHMDDLLSNLIGASIGASATWCIWARKKGRLN